MMLDAAAKLSELRALIYCEPSHVKRGRPCVGSEPMTAAERLHRHRGKLRALKIERIAVLDLETDPFDNQSRTRIHPFAACLYSDQFEPIVIWNNDPKKFIKTLLAEIERLPDAYTIYAHNGGKFDFMFLVSELRGFVKFKGRGIMSARIGPHELRDSFHIIPEPLANWQKDKIDYEKMRRKNREAHRAEIIKYMVSDCRYLFEIVRQFLNEFGLRMSIGQAAMAEVRKHYVVRRLGENMDAYLRTFFFGGRVECLMGKGEFNGPYKLFDVNSMYPHAMASYAHPVGNEFEVRAGKPGEHTIFVDLECRNFGALVRRGDSNETSASFNDGRFLTSIWEYDTARQHGLIDNITIHRCVDCVERSDFSKFVLPLYEKRQRTKGEMQELKRKGESDGDKFRMAKKDDLFYKLILNNAYGKFAQNPRRFSEFYITDPDCIPQDAPDTWGDLPSFECETYWIWQRPIKTLRFNNVATAASITGAARAILLSAIQKARDPIYCDTDSLICRGLENVKISETELGAWKLEQEFDEVLIAGKKLYACKVAGLPDGHKDRVKIRSKGVSGLTWFDMQQILNDQVIETLNFAPTMTKTGQQFYMRRRVRATAPTIVKARGFTRNRMAAA